jgi:hypothetical protein
MKRVLTIITVALTMTVGAVTACRAADDPKGQAAAIADVGELGENVYDLAKEKDWTKVESKLAELKRQAPALHSKQLSKSVVALATAVGAKDVSATMQQANQITWIATELSEPHHPQIPTDIARLDFYGRELEIWAAEKDSDKLKESADALAKTWANVQASVKEHGGSEQAKKFDGLVKKLKKAKSPKQYAAVATPILDEVDNLEKVFTK